VKESTKNERKRPNRKILFTVLTVLVLMAAVTFATCYLVIKAEAYSRYMGIKNVSAERVSKIIRGAEMNATSMFEEVSQNMDNSEAVIAALRSKAALNNDVRGYFAAFEPNFFPDRGTWFEPYIYQPDYGGFEYRQVGSARHNYTKSDWYVRAKSYGLSFWSDPYYYYDGTSMSGHYTTFVKPIYDAKGRLACICGADMTFEWLGKELQRIDDTMRDDNLLNKYVSDNADFYTVVINSDGSCIAHPTSKTLVVSEEYVKRNLKQKHSGMAEIEVDDERYIIYYAPIDHVDWSVAVVVANHGKSSWLSVVVVGFLLIAFAGFLVVWFVCKRSRKDEDF
jgi:hypothetical protein